MLSLRRLSCMPSSHRVLTAAIPCWPGRQEPSLTGYNVCWIMPQPVSSVILGSSTEAWHICSTPSCTGSMFRSESSISSEWQYTGVSKARLPSTSWTAATPHRTFASRQRLRSSSRHHLVVPRHRRSTLGRRAFSVAGQMAWNAMPDDLGDHMIFLEYSLYQSISQKRIRVTKVTNVTARPLDYTLLMSQTLHCAVVWTFIHMPTIPSCTSSVTQ